MESQHKKKCRKRKLEEEQETKIETKVDKKKRIDGDPKQRWSINKSNEYIPKINNSINTKCTSNLLHYFSKITSDQVDKERIKMAEVTVKAEIHSPKNVQASSWSNMKENKKSFKPKPYSNSKKLTEEYDKICVFESETLISSHNDQKFDSFLPQTKPKWSLKVQLQSNFAPKPDDEIYIPTQSSTQLKENVKSCRTIPKILLPMKNKNIGRKKSLLITDEYKKDNRTNFKTKIRTVNPKIGKNKAVQVESINSDWNIESKKNQDCEAKSKIEGSSSPVFDEKSLSKKGYATKLAPLFLRKLESKPENLEREQFLVQLENNGCTDSINSLKLWPEIQNVLPFPKMSHVNQLASSIDKIKAPNELDETYILSKKKLYEPLLNYSTVVSFLKVKTNNWNDDEAYDSIRADTSLALSKLQTDHSDVQSLWQTISKLSESRKLESTVGKVKYKKKPMQSSNVVHINDLWTEKYKPRNSFEVLGNEEAVLKLKTWLQNWQLSQTKEDYSSSEEFHISDYSLSNDFNSNQVAVLIGPHGTGKTATVYAVAKELGYTVLEVNASSKRPGKKILKDFEEATKSHGVKNFDLDKSLAATISKVDENDRNLKKSLIFMEDIDLIFEEDEGFVSATFQLASNTKRPIIMTLKNACLHLHKIAPHLLKINFQPIVGKKIKNLLQLIALAETGYQLSQNCMNVLCQGGDLRKSLIQLQYLLLSGKERILDTSLGVDNLTWKNMKYYIYKPAIKAEKKKKKRHFPDNDIISKVAENLENFALVSDLVQINHPTCTSSNLKCGPSTSIIQNTLPYSALHSENLEIGIWINNSIKNSSIGKKKTNCSIVDAQEAICLLSKEQFSIYINSVLSKITLSSDCQAISLDYLPSIRNICRAEERRNHLNSKRGNRFFHYLQNSRLSSGNMKISHIFSAACKVLE